MYPRLHTHIYIYSSLCYLPLRYVPNKNRGREAEREEKVVIFSYIDIVQRSKRSGNKPRRWKIKCLRFLFVPMLWRGGGVIFGNSSVSGSIGHLEITKDEMGKERTKERRRVTAFVQRRKKIRAINGVGRVPTIFIGSPFDPGDTEEIMPPVTVS